MNTRPRDWHYWVIALGIIVALFAVTVTAALVVRPTTSRTSTPAGAAYTRDEFRSLVVGKTPDEVRAAVGSPDSTSDTEGGVFWYYKNHTRDPANGTADRTQIVFRGGVVSAVNFR